MRRHLVWATVAACVVAGTLGALHFALKMRGQRTAAPQPGAVEEAQEAPRAAFVPLPKSMPSVEKLLEAMDILEPIDVEAPPADPPPLPEFGGVSLPSGGLRVAATAPAQPPRPDDEPGRRQEMPYAAEVQADRWLGARLWEALGRLLGGSEDTAPAQLNETAEPPTAEEQSEPMAVRTPLPPVVDYHYHQQEMHCPYTGHCPVPRYPVPPPAAPESK